jgi:hypothetical protein
MVGSKSRLNEEKMLNDMFVILEYSDSFQEFVDTLPREIITALHDAIDVRNERGN